MKHLTIRAKVILTCSVIFAISFISFGLIYHYSKQLRSHAVLVEMAGNYALLSQRMVALAGLVGSGSDTFSQQAKVELAKTLLQQEQSLQLMKKGGLVRGIQTPVLFPAASPLALIKINEMEAYLDEQKKYLNILLEVPASIPTRQPLPDSNQSAPPSTILNPVVEKALARLQQGLLGERLVELHTSLTDIYLYQASQSQDSFFTLLIFLLLLNTGGIVVVFLVLKSTLQPVHSLSQQIQALADGHLPAPLPVDRLDDWGHMARATNRLSDHLASAAQFANSIGEGNLLNAIAIFEHQGKLAESLYKMRDNLSNMAEEDKKRTWTSEGIARFSDILRSTTDFTQLSDQLLFNLTKYLNASQGSLFVFNDRLDQPCLELVSCYAFERKKFLTKQLLPGEGLAGQAYLEKETIYLLEIPGNYLEITSGLGGANPKALLMVPLQVNGQINGVLEMASFTHFEPYQIAFVEKLAESIASTIATLKINEQTKHLLTESQQQAEQLVAQEEMVRQNMEELEATQEEMRRNEGAHLQEITRLEQVYQSNMAHLQQKELEMRGILAAVDSTLVMIEFDLEGRILSANAPFLKAMGYQIEEIVGQHHRLFVESEYSQSEQYHRFWQQLGAGVAQIGEVKRLTKLGKEIYLSASYTPIFNEEKQVVKIIKFAQDITGQKYAALDYQSQLEAISKSNAVIEFDLQGHVLGANENFLTLMGYELQEIKGKSHRLFVQKHEQQSTDYGLFWDKLRRGEYISGEFERIMKGGKKVWIKGSYNPIKDMQGKVYKVVKYAQDVTEQKLLELQALLQTEELRAQEEEIRQNLEELQATQEEVERNSLELQAQIAAVDNSMATIEFDLEGNILKANAIFLQLMGYELEEVLQQPHRLFVEKGYGESKEYKQFWQELKTGKAQIGKVKRLTKKGVQVWLQASYTPVFDQQQRPVKVIKLAQLMEQ